MLEFLDVVEFFVQAAKNFQKGMLNLCSPLEEIVLKSAGSNLAYIDNRRDALKKYGFDFWEELKNELGEQEFDRLLRCSDIAKRLLYSKSEQFPDFMFKAREIRGRFICGSLLELKDSESGSVASFNSTIPTRFKNLEDVDVANGKTLVSRIASLIDRKQPEGEYYKFERRCFYLVRTHRCKPNRVKVSVVEGSFFETVPKDHLIHQVFLQILRNHMRKRQLTIPPDILRQVDEVLSHITDQTIIASSRIIEGSSIRPRLRIMAEVHSEGNPHSPHYPQIVESTFNLILKSTPETLLLEERLLREVPGLKMFTIQHKRNGEHIVFQLRPHSRY